MAMPLIVEQTLAATSLDVAECLIGLRARLARQNHPAARDPNWEIALAEILNNIVEHAYEDRDTGWITLRLSFSDRSLAATVTDAGAPMPGNAPPQTAPVDLDRPCHALPEGGFGWGIIRSLTRDMHYERKGGRNILRITCEYQARW